MKENSMDMIEKAEHTVIVSAEIGIPTKKCYKCGQMLPLSCFGKKTASLDGHQDMCRECHKVYMRDYYYSKKQEKETSSDKVETQKVVVESKEHSLVKVYSDAELAKFTPRQLMAELKARGYRWDYMLEPQRKISFDKI